MQDYVEFRECRLVKAGPWKRAPKEIHGAEDVYNFLRREIGNREQEVFLAVHLDARHAAVGYHVVAIGSATASLVHPREVFRTAMRNGAVAVIIAHNHPSGNSKPSDEDIRITTRLAQAGREIAGIEVLDHVVVVNDGFYSFKQVGLL